MPAIPDTLTQPLLLTGEGQRAYRTDPERPFDGQCLVRFEGPAVAVVPAAGQAPIRLREQVGVVDLRGVFSRQPAGTKVVDAPGDIAVGVSGVFVVPNG